MMISTPDTTLSHVAIKAEFVLDENKRPLAVDSRTRSHFRIKLWIAGAPDDTHAVTYHLHETYRDPIREVLDGPDFPLEITAYGDYDIAVKVRRRRFSETFKADLGTALRATYGRNPNYPAVAEAIAKIEDS